MTPPNNPDAERAVLGAMIVRPACIPDVTAILQGRDFYQPKHEATFHAITALWDEKTKPVDMLSVDAALRRAGGNPDPLYVHSLTEGAQVTANVVYHAELVLDAAVRRRLVEVGQGIIQAAHEAPDASQAAQDAQQAVTLAATHAATTDGGAVAADMVDAAMDWLDTKIEGADTPWPDVNKDTNGLLPGSLITVAGRPGHGKSLIAKDIALFTARQGKPAHIATMEMNRNEYMARILSGLAQVNLGNMLRRDMSETEWGKVAKASTLVRGLPLVLDDRERQTMAQIRSAVRATERRLGKVGVVCIDYAGLVSVPGISDEQRRLQIGHVSRESKLLAKEFDCPVVLLAQLNRGNTSRSDHTPQVTDMKESGDLEQDSDQVWLLHRPDQYAGGEDRMGEVDLIIGKNRNGPAPRTIPLAFRGHYARIDLLSPSPGQPY